MIARLEELIQERFTLMFKSILGATDNLSLKAKLILALLPITLVALYFSGTEILSQHSKSSQLGEMQTLAGYSVQASALVHESQKERGLTGLCVGSGGTNYAGDLASQRQAFDGQKTNLLAFPGTFDMNAFGPEFKATVDTFVSALDGVDTHRSDVDALNISGGSHLAYYTQMNSVALDGIAVIGSLSPDPALNQMVGAYVNFLQAKERAGIERAVLGDVFAKGGFGEGDLTKFISLVTAQDTYFSVFASMATEE